MLKMDLSGQWDVRLDETKRGIGQHFERCAFPDSMLLPGTTSVAGKGMGNLEAEVSHLTDAYPYEGYVWFQRSITLPFRSELELTGKRFVLRLERTRISTVWVDGELVGTHKSLTTPHLFDITPHIHTLCPGITIMVSNVDYPTGGGHLTSPDTQTNWNGILGEISLEITEGARIRRVKVIPHVPEEELELAVSLELPEEYPVTEAALEVEGKIVRLGDEFLRAEGCPEPWEKPLPGKNESLERSEFVKKSARPTTYEELSPYLEVYEDAFPKVSTVLDLEEGVVAGKNRNRRAFRISVPLKTDEYPAAYWDEENPNVYLLNVQLKEAKTGKQLDEKQVWTGLRELKADGGKIRVNGRKIFLRGKHDGMLFPITGFAPMDVFSWLRHFKIAKDWGMNHVRFHTCTPPEAAFIAADLLGIYLQPELELWGTWHGPSDEGYDREMQEYLRGEGRRILKSFSSHPSFCMMSMGNELWGNPEELGNLVSELKAKYPWILYTQGSNNFQWVPNIQPSDDFFSGVRLGAGRLIRGSYAMCDAPRGHIQTEAPRTNKNYDAAIRPQGSSAEETVPENSDGTVEIQYGTGVKKVKLTEENGELIPDIPVISHEIGQYETYPDYEDLSHFAGVLRPRNLEAFRERLWNAGLYEYARVYFESSGALAADCYKRELEAALSTKHLAGFQLLDLQDFTGQGTALVGMLNAMMENKGIVSSRTWRESCSDIVVMAHFPSYLATAGQGFSLTLGISYFRAKSLKEASLSVRLLDPDTEECVFAKTAALPPIKESGYRALGKIEVPIPAEPAVGVWDLELELSKGERTINKNHYRLWSYPPMKEEERGVAQKPVMASEDPGKRLRSGEVPITFSPEQAAELAQRPGSVLLYLPADRNRNSIPGTYCTDFWCYPMFRSISESMGKPVPVGTMGLLIRNAHPMFKNFATEMYSTPQWYEIVTHSASVILDGYPIRPMVQTIDNFERNHLLGMVFEVRISGCPARILVCTADLPGLIASGHPEALALHRSILGYLKGFSTFRADNDSSVCELLPEQFLALFEKTPEEPLP